MPTYAPAYAIAVPVGRGPSSLTVEGAYPALGRLPFSACLGEGARRRRHVGRQAGRLLLAHMIAPALPYELLSSPRIRGGGAAAVGRARGSHASPYHITNRIRK